jgi:hypothetical protein
MVSLALKVAAFLFLLGVGIFAIQIAVAIFRSLLEGLGSIFDSPRNRETEAKNITGLRFVLLLYPPASDSEKPEVMIYPHGDLSVATEVKQPKRSCHIFSSSTRQC